MKPKQPFLLLLFLFAAGIFIFAIAGQAIFTLLNAIALLVGGLLLMLVTPLIPILSLVLMLVGVAGLGLAILLPFWIVASLFRAIFGRKCPTKASEREIDKYLRSKREAERLSN
jgi:predicted membrane protein